MKYKLKHIIKATNMTFIGSLLFASCIGNFEEINTHPTDVYPENIPAEEKTGSLFPSMLYLLNPTHENQNQHIEQMVGQYGGYFSTTNEWDGTNFSTFNPSANWVEEPYKLLFTGFYPNFQSIKEYTKGIGYAYAWASIIRVGVMQRVTDIYGPIPYSKMGEGNFAVPYDDVQTLYHEMIDDLTKSIDALSIFLQENGNEPHPLAEYDLIYNGDFRKWIKYANSLKLRMAVRIAHLDTEYAKQAMKEAITGGVIESNEDNAFLPSNDNPICKSTNNWDDLAINASIAAYMNGYEDPRIPLYMSKILLGRVPYRGVRMGTIGISQFYSKPIFEQHSPLAVYYAAESHFLKAEAALRGWIEGGNGIAKNYYEQGIKTSMDQYKVEIGNYLNNTTTSFKYEDILTTNNVTFENAPSVSWEDGDNKLEKIITQKWIANYPLGIEAWTEFRRTGYPQLISCNPKDNKSSSAYIGSISDTRMVRRLPYPTSEKTGNATNVEQAISALLKGDDTGATDLWWGKKD